MQYAVSVSAAAKQERVKLLKELAWPAYRAMKIVLYPLILLFGMLPVLREQPHYVAGVLTLFLFGFIANRLWTDTITGAIVFVVVQAIGLILAFAFMIWGQEFEERLRS